MSDQVYITLVDINELQTSIMVFIVKWVREIKTPVPQREIVKAMKMDGIKDFTTVNALNTLLKKGYIRRSLMVAQQGTAYVQLRTI